ncbi:MAG TPA: hypothetical protein VGT78_06040 [Rhizomicrobium sp.]|nr:hypothetical protein [Rhizomicrobium sp.]
MSERSRWTAISLTIFVVGLLILIPSGLCTSIFGVAYLFGGGNLDETLSMLVTVAMVGGIPMLIGFFMVWSGLALRRKDKD